MIFKEMAREVSDKRVIKCMSIFIENSVVLSINRDVIQNAIDVTFRLVKDGKEQEYKIALMPNVIEVSGCIVELRYDGGTSV